MFNKIFFRFYCFFSVPYKERRPGKKIRFTTQENEKHPTVPLKTKGHGDRAFPFWKSKIPPLSVKIPENSCYENTPVYPVCKHSHLFTNY